MDGSFTVKKLKTEDLFFFTSDAALGRDGGIEFETFEVDLVPLIDTSGKQSDLGDGLHSDCGEPEATATTEVFVDIFDVGSGGAYEDRRDART